MIHVSHSCNEMQSIKLGVMAFFFFFIELICSLSDVERHYLA